MDVETAKANLVPGKEVQELARCMDTLLSQECNDPSVFPQLLPFLGPNLIERKIIDYSIEPGVDITNHYFVLWEPFVRAKSALLIGTIAEKCKELPDCAELIEPLITMLKSKEDIEYTFAIIAVSNIGLKRPEYILPHFSYLSKRLPELVYLASSVKSPFSLFYSVPFQSEVYESCVSICEIKGVFDNTENLNRLIDGGIPMALNQISRDSEKYKEKKPELKGKVDKCIKLLNQHLSNNKH